MKPSQKKVSVGIPTYNRKDGLRKAVLSLLEQNYENLEIIITDNCSPDYDGGFIDEICRLDSRIKYIRHSKNLGPVLNFESSRKIATGEYFFWLADDDWIEKDYLRKCIEYLENNDDYVLVGSLIRYYKNNNHYCDVTPTKLTDKSGIKRVLNYYKTVRDNGIYYGIMRRQKIINIPLKPVLGSDWLFTASIAFSGKIGVVDDVLFNRDYSWNENSIYNVAKQLNLSEFEINNPYLAIAYAAKNDIISSPVYNSLSKLKRWWLAQTVFRIICSKKKVKLTKILSSKIKYKGFEFKEIGR